MVSNIFLRVDCIAVPLDNAKRAIFREVNVEK